MIKYSLSAPQRTVAGCIVAIALLTIAGLAGWGWYSWQTNRPKPISVAAVSNSAHVQGDKGNTTVSGFAYDEVITITQGFIDARVDGHRILAVGPASFTVNAIQIKFLTGIGLAEVGNQIALAGTSSIAARNVRGIFDAALQRFVILDGTINLSGNELSANRVVSLRQATPSAGVFDRSVFTTDAWVRLRTAASEQGININALTDITPPQLTLAPPANSSILSGDALITGEFNEPVVGVQVNGRDIEIESNLRFSTNVNIQPGENRINISAVDAAGNQLTADIAYVGLSNTLP